LNKSVRDYYNFKIFKEFEYNSIYRSLVGEEESFQFIDTEEYILSKFQMYQIFHNLILRTRDVTGKSYLYRGLNEKIITDNLIGKEVIFTAFSSSTFDIDLAIEYGDKQLLILEVDENIPAFEMLIGWNSEQELLIIDNSKWKVISRQENKYTDLVRVTDIFLLKYICYL